MSSLEPAAEVSFRLSFEGDSFRFLQLFGFFDIVVFPFIVGFQKHELVL